MKSPTEINVPVTSQRFERNESAHKRRKLCPIYVRIRFSVGLLVSDYSSWSATIPLAVVNVRHGIPESTSLVSLSAVTNETSLEGSLNYVRGARWRLSAVESGPKLRGTLPR